MSHVKKGHLTASGEWRKHLRPAIKMQFWKRHRQVERQAVSESANDTIVPSDPPSEWAWLDELIGNVDEDFAMAVLARPRAAETTERDDFGARKPDA